MKCLSLLLPALAFAISLASCSKDDDADTEQPMVGCGDFAEGTTREHYGREKPQFCDARDGKTYVYAKIGTQTWMAENLNYNASGSVCYNNDPANCELYGRLYDFETAKKVCPQGWHLPSKAELAILTNFAGGEAVAGTKLKAASGWDDWEGKSGNGTDNYGFAALPGGEASSDGGFFNVGNTGEWNLADKEKVMIVGMEAEIEAKFSLESSMPWLNSDGGSCCGWAFMSVRCLK